MKDVFIVINPASAGILYVTVSKHNYLPYEGEIDVSSLSCDTYTIPSGTGGTVNFYLNAGSANAGRTYIILGSLSGTSPGTPCRCSSGAGSRSLPGSPQALCQE